MSSSLRQRLASLFTRLRQSLAALRLKIWQKLVALKNFIKRSWLWRKLEALIRFLKRTWFWQKLVALWNRIKRSWLWQKLAGLHFRLWQKLVVLFLISMLPLIGIIIFNLAHLFGDLEEAAINDHVGDARLAAVSFNRFAHELSEIGTAAGLAIVENNLSPTAGDRYLKDVRDPIVKHHFPIDNIFFTDQRGIVVSSTMPGSQGRDLSGQPAFKAVAKGADLSVSELLRTDSGQPGVLYFAPINRGGAFVGSVAIAVDGVSFRQLIPQQLTHDVIIVTDSTGNLVFSNKRELSNLPIEKRRFGNLEFIRTARQGRDFTTTGILIPRLEGDHLGAQVPVKGIGWTSGIFDPAGEALAHVGREAAVTIPIIVTIIVVSGIAGAIYIRGVSKPVRKLTDITTEIGLGNLDVPVDVRTRDEIGVLADNFRRMREHLKRTFSEVTELNIAARHVNSTLEISSVARIALDYIKKIIETNGVIITASTARAERAKPLILADRIDEETAVKLSRSIGEIAREIGLSEKGYAIVDMKEEVAERLGEERERSGFLLLLPLVVKGKVVGRIDIFTIPTVSLAEFEQVSVGLAASFAQHAAVAIENARLFEEQRTVAEILQDSLLTKPQYIPGLEIGLAYYPTTIGARIGGDFYDFFSLPENKIVIVIGDISGKGIEAAGFTSIAKGAIRSFALENPTPDSVLSRASRVIAEQTGSDVFISAAYALVDVRTGIVSYSIAGHPSPMVYAKRYDRVLPLGGRGIPLGTRLPDSYTGMQATMYPGDKLVLYTDGLTEARRDGELFGEERVADAIYELKEVAAKDLAERVAERAIEFSAERLEDDLAVISIERRP